MKSVTKNVFGWMMMGVSVFSLAQNGQSNTNEIDATPAMETQQMVNDSVRPAMRQKVDGVAAVVGSYVILESDIDKAIIEMQQEGMSVANMKRCFPLDKLMEAKLYAHHAVQDSIVVNDGEIYATVDQQIGTLLAQVGSEARLLEFYKKPSMEEMRLELYNINKDIMLARRMQGVITEETDVSPEQVREFFYTIPEEDRPQIGVELEIAQIIIRPEVSEVEERRVIDRLNQMRADVLENGSSFATKAVMNSEDRSTARDGGRISLKRTDPYVKEFKEAAFSLQEGEISEPFETIYGWHILTVDKIRGEYVDVRHVLLYPTISEGQKEVAREKMESIRQEIESGEITFEEAALEYSDQEETRGSGGRLTNPQTGDFRFDLTRTDPDLYTDVQDLGEGELSQIIVDRDRRTGRESFKLMTVASRSEAHQADYQLDYLRIKELALKAKQIEAIQKWQNEKIQDTYIKVNAEYQDCEFESNWTNNN